MQSLHPASVQVQSCLLTVWQLINKILVQDLQGPRGAGRVNCAIHCPRPSQALPPEDLLPRFRSFWGSPALWSLGSQTYMSSQHAKKAAPCGSPAVLCTYFYLFSCICWRPTIQGDFPSKHKTKQNSSLSIKTCIPLCIPLVPNMSHYRRYLHEPHCWRPVEVMKLVTVSVISNGLRWVAMETRKCQQISSDPREPSSSQQWTFGASLVAQW